MRKLGNIVVVCVVGLGLTAAWAQDSSTPSSEPAPSSSQPQEPAAAYGQQGSNTPISENPPLTTLDLPSLEPHAAPLSYWQPGATFDESLDSNVANQVGGGTVSSVTRALGSLTLHRLWSHYDLALDYVGGIGYYDVNGQGLKDLQQMGVDQKVLWKRGELTLRDSFSYLPEGNFGGSYGSLGSTGTSLLGSTSLSSFYGGSALGAIGLTPRILNLSVASVEQSLTPKSAITATAGYAFLHFLGNDVSGAPFIGSSEISGQVAYDRLLTSHTQVAAVYGYQGFDFSYVGTAFHSNVFEGMYGHRITGRMDLLLGAGPQLTFIDTQSAVCSEPSLPLLLCTFLGGTLKDAIVKNTNLGVAAQARLRYQFTRTSLTLEYERFQTSGAGLFAGAQSNIARLNAARPLSRVWNAFVDIGYARNSRVQPLTIAQVNQCASRSGCPANDATAYNYGFAGGGLHRDFGRNLHGFVSYQINELAFDNSFCVGTATCNRISNRQVLSVGLDWTPRPMRID